MDWKALLPKVFWLLRGIWLHSSIYSRTSSFQLCWALFCEIKPVWDVSQFLNEKDHLTRWGLGLLPKYIFLLPKYPFLLPKPLDCCPSLDTSSPSEVSYKCLSLLLVKLASKEQWVCAVYSRVRVKHACVKDVS